MFGSSGSDASRESSFERQSVFVTTCTDSRGRILAAESIHQAFVQFAVQGMDRGAWLGAYVLMPDHLHLFVGFNDPKIQLSQWMKSLKNTLSKTLRLDGIGGPAEGFLRSFVAKRRII
jgi:REP element-mobilizing transposase RayT